MTILYKQCKVAYFLFAVMLFVFSSAYAISPPVPYDYAVKIAITNSTPNYVMVLKKVEWKSKTLHASGRNVPYAIPPGKTVKFTELGLDNFNAHFVLEFDVYPQTGQGPLPSGGLAGQCQVDIDQIYPFYKGIKNQAPSVSVACKPTASGNIPVGISATASSDGKVKLLVIPTTS